MGPPRIRPRFEVFVDTSAQEVLQRVEDRIEGSGAIRGWVSVPYAELRVPTRDRFLWSPRLAIYAEDTPGGTNLSCRFQPEPDVWTAYMAIWAVVGAATLGTTMVGLSQWVVTGMPSLLLLGLPAGALLGLSLRRLALAGQRWGAAQMWLLERELDAALGGSLRLEDAIDDLPEAGKFGRP
ncbi:MAG: hypothetical protein KDK70_06120 [Myxococcales bacterium]|nr:hypothetical protein [Myxococcales bacterium]